MRTIFENAIRSPWKSASNAIAVSLAVFAVYVASQGIFDTIIVYGTTVLLAVAYSFFSPADPASRFAAVTKFSHPCLGLLFIWLIWRWMGIMLEQEEFFVSISDFDFAMAWVAFGVLGYLTWRQFGLPMVTVYAAAIAYALLPSDLGGAGLDWSSIADRQWFTTDGVFGRPVQVVTTVVLVFVVFGAVMQNSGAGAILLKMAFSATSRIAGGPAHAAIIASAMFGTMSGAAVANVVSTGVFTIPIIKKAGFSPRFAGAVEATASTGGQIMPPVMGVVAFIMADVTAIPYLLIILAAFLPAVFYYFSLFTVVLIEARKQGIGALPVGRRQSVTADDWIKSLAFWVPLAIIVLVLATGRTAQNAGFFALASSFAMNLVLFPDFRKPSRWWSSLVSAGRTAASLMIVVASVGIVIGLINMTGIGLAFADAIRATSGQSLFFALLLVMLGCLIMGMGVPSVTAYLLLALVMGPVLENLGISKISAHMFMLYFGVLSVVTPPVALAAFAAAPIANAGPMETAAVGVRLAFTGFVIPFFFVYRPEILIIDGFEPLNLAWAVICLAIGSWGATTGLARFEVRRLSLAASGMRLLAALAVLTPEVWSSIAGGLVIAAAFAIEAFRSKRGEPLPRKTH
ncbi:MAG: TRAP transporter fused permease subunit [Albidovulum sp.]|nr:TRAP transporter fused permease subunit [Albidovulum sp.]